MPSSKTPRSRGAKYEDQRETILSSAASLFARRGYLGTSMNDVAEASGLSKATLYHYYRDKDEMLVSIADEHVSRLVDLVRSVERDATLAPEDRLEALITRFLIEYSDAQNSHRVLTEDVRFLEERDRERVLNKERLVVKSFAEAIAVQAPQLREAGLEKPVAMLLFGMLNWMFTWLKPNGRLTHASIAPVVVALISKGLDGVADIPLAKKTARKRAPSTT
ncbi:MAG: TetR/AcrR family transcriptional regulator [Pseudomonadota bacterium]